jgi:hypothetical protein
MPPVQQPQDRTQPSRHGAAPTVIDESRLFSWILVAVISLLFLSFLAWILSALIIADPSASQSGAETGASWAFFAVLGVLTGLLTGKLT